MAKILFIHPNRWGRGITALWIPSHTQVLRARGHEVRLFDCTFYRDWTCNETAFNTANQQYRPTDYESHIQWREGLGQDLQAAIDDFRPNLIFWGSVTSHIHGEGEYVSLQYGHDLLKSLDTGSARLVAGGIQATTAPRTTLDRFPRLDYVIAGETELVLAELAATPTGAIPERIHGLAYRTAEGTVVNPRQPLITNLDAISPYDYSLFEDQVFLRPYNGQVVRAVDYELSRGCPFSCGYCVETVIQSYYGFRERTPRGMIRHPARYVRTKSAGMAFHELAELHRSFGVTLIRTQDTNFLTIPGQVLRGLAERMEAARLPISLYIETRPEGINPATIPLLQRLRVDGIGMGIELSGQTFREKQLNRYSDTDKILRAFRLLRAAGIRRTAYNVIGFPDQNEASIIETIRFNRVLDPDNVTVAFYTPYLGTEQQRRGTEQDYFSDYEMGLDNQLRTVGNHPLLPPRLLEFYKSHFNRLVREGLDHLPELKINFGLRD